MKNLSFKYLSLNTLLLYIKVLNVKLLYIKVINNSGI